MLKKKVIRRLEKIVGRENCSTCQADLVCYSYDAVNKRFLPDAVVFPANGAEISAVIDLANKEQFPVIPRGGGTGFSGGSLAVRGGVVLVTTRLNRIIALDTENLTAIVEPGVICGDFQEEVEKRGLYYPPDPSSLAFSTLGGNAAECAGGPHGLKYGVTRDYITGLEVVLPTGEIMKTGVQTMKGVVGYDLTRLIVGSEGTLAIITKIYLRLLPKPESSVTIMAVFCSMRSSAETVASIIRDKIVPSKLEFLDQESIRCVETYRDLNLPKDTAALLLIELDGDISSVEKQAERVVEICRKGGAFLVNRAHTAVEADRLWEIRRAISPSLLQLNPTKINEDIVVPRSKIPDILDRIENIRTRYQLKIATFGHAGDGNIHVNLMVDDAVPGEIEKADKAVGEIFEEVLKLGGTISGEHGIGITKAPYISMELSEAEIALMRKIKRIFDPNDILNPGKVFYDSPR
ncbi:MAG: FAD-binding protein [Deltaproteobacteria bacterium]|nr:FAD-binding protein [Deltaproteobacteria bacterium]